MTHIMRGQCIATHFSRFEEKSVQDSLKRLRTLLLWYQDVFNSRKLKNIENRWWRKIITWYKALQFQKLIKRCEALWDEIARIDYHSHALALSNVHLIQMSRIVPHVRFLGYWGKSELENSIFHWSAIEECLQKTVTSLK